MKRRDVLLAVMIAALQPAFAQAPKLPEGLDPANTLLIELKNGTVIIKLRPDLAPNHVERIKILTKRGFYNGIVFHRVIDRFMAQTGDPTGTGTGRSDLPDLKAEFTPTPFMRGTLGMARSQNPNSANSQFFICFERSQWLDGQYTVFGEVVSGMEFVDLIKKGTGDGGTVAAPPDRMQKVSLAAE